MNGSRRGTRPLRIARRFPGRLPPPSGVSYPRTLAEDPSHEGYDYAIVLTEAEGFWVSAAPHGPGSRWLAVDEAQRLFAADEDQPLTGSTERIDAHEVSI